MNLKKKFSMATQMLAAVFMIAALVASCGGGSSGFSQAYTSSAGVGEVLQFSVDTAQMTYTYTVNYTSYAASGVVAGQSGKGSLLGKNPNGSYSIGVSSDGFVKGGTVLPIQNGLLVGHVQIAVIGGTNRIPVIGLSNPITTVAGLAGTYNYHGFGCSALGIANVLGNPACFSHVGTVTINSSGAFTQCKGGDISTSPGANPCVATVTGTINALAATPGVFDFRNAANNHIGWFFAYNASTGQKIAVIDHDDAITVPFMYGHTVLITYASAVSGTADGNYFVKNNEGGEYLVTVAGANLSSTTNPGVPGTMTLNSPWPGLSSYQFVSGVIVASSGVAMTTGAGLYTYANSADSAVFGVGVRYSR